MHYYGKRSSKAHPSEDIGVKYFSSSSDRMFIAEQKEYPGNFKYKVVRIFERSEDALLFEIKLHEKFQVDTHQSFYNKSKQTSSKWTTTGKTTSEETRRLLSAAMKNRVMSDEHKMNLSTSAKGKIKSAAHCKNISDAQSKLKWIHNKSTSEVSRIEKGSDLPPGWSNGRPKGSCTGLVWIYNPMTLDKSMIQKNGPLPEGWKFGRGPKNTWKFKNQSS